MIIDTLHRTAPPQTAPRSSGVTRRRLALALACWGYLFLVIAVWLVIREIGDRWWPATVLLLSPRWPWMIPLAVLWGWLALERRWRTVWPVAAATWVVLVPVLGLRVSWPHGGEERADIRLMTCNVHRQHLDVERLQELLASVRPDVVALQGWSQTNHETVFAGGGWDVRSAGELLVASRIPIGEFRPLDLLDTPDTPAAERGTAALVELRLPGGAIHLITVHLASPHGGLMTALGDSGRSLGANVERRWCESGRLRALADDVKGPLLLAGDFNTTDDSPLLREHWEDFADGFSVAGAGLGYTYLNGHTQLRIDHILGSSGCLFERCWVAMDIGSPHRPLVADVKLGPRASDEGGSRGQSRGGSGR